MITSRPGESTTPSKQFNRPASESRSSDPDGGVAPSPLASRESTTSDTQSTSSKTNVQSETATFVASPSTWYRSSKSHAASFSFVPTWDNLMFTTWRRVRAAMALISDVLPVPGGPHS